MTMNYQLPLTCEFTKGDKSITYIHDKDDTMAFVVANYPEEDNTILVGGAESMNLMMNLLAEAGYESDAII